MRIISFTLRVLLFIFLTISTQVGGIIYLIYKPLGLFLDKKPTSAWKKSLIKTVAFVSIYLIFTLLLIPAVAKRFGRVQLPFEATATTPIKPRSIWFCLLNRTYVKPELKTAMIRTAQALNKTYPDTYIVYLDSGFPFLNGFPLLPHLSHNDGEKIDIALFYNDSKTGKRINSSPSFMGYGVSEEPRTGERNRPAECAAEGYEWYSFMRNYLISQAEKSNFIFDESTTTDYLRILVADKSIGKILLEPHLKQRLGLSNVDKIRLHGCQAVRHDDHIHIQL
jgi:hypothetical protein